MIKDLRFSALVLVLLFLFSCSKTLQKENVQINEKEPLFLKEQVLIFGKDGYVNLTPIIKPEPNQGEKQFLADIYTNIRYPSVARKKGIEGSTLFEIIINEKGEVETIILVKSLSLTCDREAEKAIRIACEKGFNPFEYEGEVVKVKYLIPINFRLH